jgi:hypothetical protein
MLIEDPGEDTLLSIEIKPILEPDSAWAVDVEVADTDDARHTYRVIVDVEGHASVPADVSETLTWSLTGSRVLPDEVIATKPSEKVVARDELEVLAIELVATFGDNPQEIPEYLLLWPHPIVQLNPAFEPGGTIDELVNERVLHERCREIFRRDKSAESTEGEPLRLHRHQREAIEASRHGGNYVLTTGTGSGRASPTSYRCRQRAPSRYLAWDPDAHRLPMNALANSQPRLVA